MGRIPGIAEATCINHFARALGGAVVLRRHTFDFLRGDSTPKRPRGVMLPVDAYFPAHDLVLEFMGPQHFQGNPLMDRRAGRKEQRARYQERRTIVLAQHKIRLIRVRFDEPLSDELVHEKLRAVGIWI